MLSKKIGGVPHWVESGSLSVGCSATKRPMKVKVKVGSSATKKSKRPMNEICFFPSAPTAQISAQANPCSIPPQHRHTHRYLYIPTLSGQKHASACIFAHHPVCLPSRIPTDCPASHHHPNNTGTCKTI